MTCHLCEDYGVELCRDTECPFPRGETEQWKPERFQCGTKLSIDRTKPMASPSANVWTNVGCAERPEPEPEPAVVVVPDEDDVVSMYRHYFGGLHV